MVGDDARLADGAGAAGGRKRGGRQRDAGDHLLGHEALQVAVAQVAEAVVPQSSGLVDLGGVGDGGVAAGLQRVEAGSLGGDGDQGVPFEHAALLLPKHELDATAGAEGNGQQVVGGLGHVEHAAEQDVGVVGLADADSALHGGGAGGAVGEGD